MRQGGINGRKVELHLVRRRLQPPKTVEMARSWSSRRGAVRVPDARHAFHTAIHKYMNIERKVPQMHVATGATKWNDPKNHRDHGLAAELPGRGEGLRPAHPEDKPTRRSASFSRTTDYGKDYLKGFTTAWATRKA